MSGRWSVAIFTTCPNHPPTLPPPPICENKGFGVGSAPQSQKYPPGTHKGGFKLIWGKLSFIFPTELSFSPDQNLYPRLFWLQELRVPQSKCQGSEGQGMECPPHPAPTCRVGAGARAGEECTHKLLLGFETFSEYKTIEITVKHTHDWYYQ